MINYSVLIPVYCKEKAKNFDLALKSVFDQTYKSNDVVIVCDGPLTPDLDLVIEKYSRHDALSVIRLDSNRGLGVALNIGLEQCKNEIVMRADSDDYSLPKRAEIEMSYLINYNLDLVGSNIYEFVDSFEELKSSREVPYSRKDIKKFCKTRNPFNHPSVMFKKSVIQSVGGYVEFPYFEDYYLWARIISKQEYTYGNMNNVLVYMRIGDADDQLKRRFSKQAIKSSYDMIKKLKELKIVNCFEFNFIIILRKIFNSMPFALKKCIYKKALRKKVCNSDNEKNIKEIINQIKNIIQLIKNGRTNI